MLSDAGCSRDHPSTAPNKSCTSERPRNAPVPNAFGVQEILVPPAPPPPPETDPASQCDGSRDGLEPKVFTFIRRLTVCCCLYRFARPYFQGRYRKLIIAYRTHRSSNRRIANGTSSGYVAHHAIIRSNLSESSEMALISTSSASTICGSLMQFQNRIDSIPGDATNASSSKFLGPQRAPRQHRKPINRRKRGERN